MPSTIYENLQRLQQSKSDISQAITDMGGVVDDSDGFTDFADDIRTIPQGTPQPSGKIYGIKIDLNNPDEYEAVTYTYDASNFTPMTYNSSTGNFNYGSWSDMWFMRELYPVALKFDGTEDYKLDPNDYSKKIDGTPSDISNSNYQGNFMIAFPKIYFRRRFDEQYNYIEISDTKISDDFYAYAHMNKDGIECDYIYLSIYKGCIINNILRSISNVTPTTTKGDTGYTIYTDATDESVYGYAGYQINDWSTQNMIEDLLVLLSKRLIPQKVFGSGYYNFSSPNKQTGTSNNSGLFKYGNSGISGGTYDIKLFGIENIFHNIPECTLGFTYSDLNSTNSIGYYRIKMYPPYDQNNLTNYKKIIITPAAVIGSTSSTNRSSNVSKYIACEFGLIPYDSGFLGNSSNLYYYGINNAIALYSYGNNMGFSRYQYTSKQFSFGVSTSGSYKCSSLLYKPILNVIKISTNPNTSVELIQNNQIIDTSVSDNNGIAIFNITTLGDYTVRAKIKNSGYDNWIYSNTSEQITISSNTGVVDVELKFISISILFPSNSTYTITNGITTYTGTVDNYKIKFYIPNTGNWTCSYVNGNDNNTKTISITNYEDYLVSFFIYGVTWDKSSSSSFTRTDDSINFDDPNPFVNDGEHPGYSPFDNLYPWCEIQKETFSDFSNVNNIIMNVMVKIPKYYYKIINNDSEFTIKISPAPQDGFKLSPAHMKRNNSDHERDYVYIGRYKCTTKDGTNSPIATGLSRSGGEVYITNSGIYRNYIPQNYYNQDFALYWTIRFLYLVEFANWNAQLKIGLDVGTQTGTYYNKTGSSDNMPYHTGTMQTSRDIAGLGVQYRWIEDLWGGYTEYCDGILSYGGTSYKMYCTIDYTKYKNLTKADAYNYPSDWTYINAGTGTSIQIYTIVKYVQSSDPDYDWALIPYGDSSIVSFDTYVSDGIQNFFNTSSGTSSSAVNIISFGGYSSGDSSKDNKYGLFSMFNITSTSDGSLTYCGSPCMRLMYLP